MLDFLLHFFLSLLFIASITLLVVSICGAIESGIRSTVTTQFDKLEQRFRERETERLEREKRQQEYDKRQQEHEERMRKLRDLGSGT